jgi:hypothetical protein
MAAVAPTRYFNRHHTEPICEEWLSPAEREIASGQLGVGCRGCYRIMRPPGRAVPPDDVFAGMRLARRALP